MTMFDDARTVERPAFFDGQQLYAEDLQGLDGFHRALRWLHNRSLHQPGVGNGFAVAGSRGDREVRIQPGYALDADGREIVLLETAIEPVPPVAADADGGPVAFDLTVSYPEDADLEEAETREGVCLPRGAVRLRERPIFCWVRLVRDVNGTLAPVDPRQRLDLQQSHKIAIARAFVRNCALDADLVIAARRNARPDPCPHMAFGRVLPVAWQVWTAGPDDLPIGLIADVDTSAAGFRIVPNYQARVTGGRPLTLEPSEIEGPRSLLLDVPAFTTQETKVGFRCYVPLVALFGGLVTSQEQDLKDKAAGGWGLQWMGVEP
jgi:hypothetical protein